MKEKVRVQFQYNGVLVKCYIYHLLTAGGRTDYYRPIPAPSRNRDFFYSKGNGNLTTKETKACFKNVVAIIPTRRKFRI